MSRRSGLAADGGNGAVMRHDATKCLAILAVRPVIPCRPSATGGRRQALSIVSASGILGVEMTRLATHALSVRRRAGFTLIEIMVTVAVLAIVLAIAVPAFGTLIRSNRLTSNANELVAALQLARSEAVRQNSSVAVCRSDNGSTCAAGGAWGQVITVVVRSGQVLRVNQVRAGLIVEGSPALNSLNDRIAFSPDGLARGSSGSPLNGRLSVCLVTSSPAENNRNIVITNGSRIAVEKGAQALCSAPTDS